MAKHKRNNPGKPSWRRRLIGWAPLVLLLAWWMLSYTLLSSFQRDRKPLLTVHSYYGGVSIVFSSQLEEPPSHTFVYIFNEPFLNYGRLFRLPTILEADGLWLVYIPYYVFVIPAALWLWFIALRRRPMPGYCPKCDYDLRGSVGANTCPECGADVTRVESD